MHQCDFCGKNKTIRSLPQIQFYKNKLEDRLIKVDGSQHINILDKCKTYISIRNALPCTPLRPCNDYEWENLPHVILTSDKDWDPTSLDCEENLGNDTWFDAQSSWPDGLDK